MELKFGFITFASKLLKPSEQNMIMHEFSPLLSKNGGEQWTVEQFRKDLPLVFFILSGGTEKLVLDFIEKNYPDSREPVYLIAHPYNNSLPAAFEIFARIRQKKCRGNVFYLTGEEDNIGFKKLISRLQAARIYSNLRTSRIGLIGGASDWLVASQPDFNLISSRWGPEIIPLTFADLDQKVSEISPEEILSMYDSLTVNSLEIEGPSPQDIKNSVKIYLGLKKVIDAYDLHAISLRCFDLLDSHQSTGCLALAKLNSENYIGGCEGDLISTLTQLWLKLHLGKVAWMANPVQLDEERYRLQLAHCSVPFSMISDYRLKTHFESDSGVGISGNLKSGVVTLIRLGGADLQDIWLAEGELIRNLSQPAQCRTQIEIQLFDRNTMQSLLENPLGNHLVMIYGAHARELLSWWYYYIK
ncbi:MAG: hypothetical protein JW996_02075 [Candidatus Cloacimonetes bacterium]|nr:hypothetical protein [Candidatus Cloacimonadota bacterium]